MINTAADVTTLKMNIDSIRERLRVLPENYIVLRRTLGRHLDDMEDRLYEIEYLTLKYDPSRQLYDDDDI
ncbi:hypothetical protein U8P76_02885 [Rhizobium johnstonii]|jgi:hypothetical protein|uniref:hypothetical protein n=1 Tax=Rhizobium leguminosarum TaxID=384 RepID=UPI0013BF6B69|nr:hypothetical protein [Rhizobium leguminosarum]WSG95979.1 hypothetical protein U8P76_02885 [Rhizobium johnstonii]NEH99001.1 hypothetical protein [Rhizobium leguminosarum]NEJ42085.1 hypothetical protein [Rhizobium leguminosarum]NEJ49106.1 hypothetical protein [Rhizobium leguminosarum]NEJ82801.1 hypothetical protein [Rhizobium leguminosarum]